MRLVIPLLLICAVAGAQTSAPSADPVYAPLSKAFEFLRNRDYDKAIGFFEKAVEAAPTRPSIRKEPVRLQRRERARVSSRIAIVVEPSERGRSIDLNLMTLRSFSTARKPRKYPALSASE
jgi:hypothetical protein